MNKIIILDVFPSLKGIKNPKIKNYLILEEIFQDKFGKRLSRGVIEKLLADAGKKQSKYSSGEPQLLYYWNRYGLRNTNGGKDSTDKYTLEPFTSDLHQYIQYLYFPFPGFTELLTYLRVKKNSILNDCRKKRILILIISIRFYQYLYLQKDDTEKAKINMNSIDYENFRNSVTLEIDEQNALHDIYKKQRELNSIAPFKYWFSNVLHISAYKLRYFFMSMNDNNFRERLDLYLNARSNSQFTKDLNEIIHNIDNNPLVKLKNKDSPKPPLPPVVEDIIKKHK
ncbi:hypothetical protein CTM97_04245 [Photobacterium phosphoreum]|uniref:Uncharacterized protein n=1 Tax=Photobacterium phosphoreum TaxID=659 RepID=A0A2T3JWI6_PHOPO|nr:hypothetical protein [Photobacterium phosphoreum]PSU25757.1 hypothetical protein CTM96_08595 [Photobacterium phosphoreum]PSU43573.1 hypothetical protein CTM97_04245 [Photobacterium phosphoreum]PSU53694.1 hypothetical protein C9J18_04630 [Photobacterium phosphoreum]PSU68749.1 hypothetical protein CTM67_20410 [Photobacterium phosphoreum]